MKLIVPFVFVIGLCSCAGSFEESRAHVRVGVVGAPELTPRCVSLDSKHRDFGAIGKGAAVLAGAAALGELPSDESKGVRIGIAAGALTFGAVAAFSVFESESAATSYIAEGCGK